MIFESHCDGNVLIGNNFLSKEESEKITEWMQKYNWENLQQNPVRFWGKRMITLDILLKDQFENDFQDIKSFLFTINDRLKIALSSIKNDEWLPSPISLIKMFPGSNPIGDKKLEMFYHIDNQQHMPQPIIWGSVIYPNNNYEGGEILYPEYNFSYKPTPGSLVLHSGETVHGVNKVTSGERYCITSLIFQKDVWSKNPLPTPTNNPNSYKYIYPVGYWGNRMKDDDQSGVVKIVRPDGTTSDFIENPEIQIEKWQKRLKDISEY